MLAYALLVHEANILTLKTESLFCSSANLT